MLFNLTRLSTPTVKILKATSKHLGRGAHGSFELVNWKGQEVVLKQIFPEHDLPVFLKEIGMLAKADGASGTPRILAYHQNERILLQDYVRGQLLSDLLKPNTLAVHQWIEVLHKVTKNLEALHERGIVHSDMHPHNVIVNKSPLMTNATLIDLGRSRIIGADASPKQDLVNLGFLVKNIHP